MFSVSLRLLLWLLKASACLDHRGYAVAGDARELLGAEPPELQGTQDCVPLLSLERAQLLLALQAGDLPEDLLRLCIGMAGHGLVLILQTFHLVG